MEEKLSVVNLTKIKKLKFALPAGRQAFVDIKNDILGKDYSLSIAFVDVKQSQKINNEYRNKNKPTNILSFSLRKNEGEIIMCPGVIKKEAKNFDKTFEQFIILLVIHGMLHLKGLEHSSTMERAEKEYDEKYNSRDRLGVRNDASHSRRILKGRKKS